MSIEVLKVTGVKKIAYEELRRENEERELQHLKNKENLGKKMKKERMRMRKSETGTLFAIEMAKNTMAEMYWI